jgi:hypothetical protein
MHGERWRHGEEVCGARLFHVYHKQKRVAMRIIRGHLVRGEEGGKEEEEEEGCDEKHKNTRIKRALPLMLRLLCSMQTAASAKQQGEMARQMLDPPSSSAADLIPSNKHSSKCTSRQSGKIGEHHICLI